MKTFLFRLLQWTWGLPQTLIGAILWIIFKKSPHGKFRECVITYWPIGSSLGVGMFLFIGRNDRQVVIHEYGHAIQSAFLGPLFLPVMGIPSFLWCNLPWAKKLRRDKRISYYDFYPESTANRLGSWASKEICNLR